MNLPPSYISSDIERPNIYWSNRSGGKNLERLNTDGTGNKVILAQKTGLEVSGAIAYYSNWIYFLNEAFPNKVSRCELNGSNFENLANGTGDLRQLTVCDGGIFFSNYLNGDSVIFRCDLDGSNITTIYSDYAVLEGLCNDGTHLYFYERDFDTGVKRIVKMNFDGSNITTILSEGTIDNGSAVRDVDVAGNYIYWINNGGVNVNSRIMRADKDGSNVTTLVSSNDAAQVGLFSFIVGETEIYYLIAFGSSPVDAGIYKCDLDGSNFPTKLLGGEPFPYTIALG